MSGREDDHNDFKAQRVRALEDLRLAEQVFKEYRNKKWESLESWAGDLLVAMLVRQSDTAKHLQHPNWSIRLAALLLLDDRWQGVATMAEAYADIVMTDPVGVIRGAALRLLADSVRNESLPELPEGVRHLSPVVLDPATDDEEIREARSAVFGMLTDIAKVRAADRKRRREELHRLAGSLEDALLQDRSLALASLEHPNPLIRCAALNLFDGHWKPPPDFDQICIRMMNEDADTRVRCTALSVLLMTKVELDDPVLGSRLADLVRDVAQPLDLRELAYYWLF